MKYIKLILVLVLANTASCSDDSDSASPDPDTSFSLSGTEFIITKDSGLSVSTENLSGEGSVLASAPLEGVEAGAHFVLNATLAESSSLALLAFTNSEQEQGISIQFENASGVLSVSMSSGGETVDISEFFQGKSATDISYGIDVHNGEGDAAHILIWDGDEQDFEEDTALLDTEEDQVEMAQGGGSFWGAVINNATVTTLSSEEEKFEE